MFDEKFLHTLLARTAEIGAAGLRLAPREVHVWSVDLETTRHIPESTLRQVLASDERSRADRFRFATDRLHFTACRALLRKLLSCYGAGSPEQIRFRYGPYGKPFLFATNESERSIWFSVSHSRNLAVLAIAPSEVGIDVERIRSDVEFQQFATSYFSPGECKRIFSHPRNRHREYFFAYWSAKEAVVKAEGCGLSASLQEFSVLLSDDSHWAEVASEPHLKLAKWRVRLLPTAIDYRCALAIEGTDWKINEMSAFGIGNACGRLEEIWR